MLYKSTFTLPTQPILTSLEPSTGLLLTGVLEISL